jgi:hypothetical protein
MARQHGGWFLATVCNWQHKMVASYSAEITVHSRLSYMAAFFLQKLTYTTGNTRCRLKFSSNHYAELPRHCRGWLVSSITVHNSQSKMAAFFQLKASSAQLATQDGS